MNNSEARPIKHVLVACTGNLFRSPLSAAFLRQVIEEKGLQDQVQVLSAGLSAQSARPVPEALQHEALVSFNIDLSAHRSQPLTVTLFQQADVVLLMEEEQLTRLARQYPLYTRKMHLLSELGGGIFDIRDPVLDPNPDLAALARQLDTLINKGWPVLAHWLGVPEAVPQKQAVRPTAAPLPVSDNGNPDRPVVNETAPRSSGVHSSAEIAPTAAIGANTSIWGQAQVRENAVIGTNCTIGKGAYIDAGVIIGDSVKIQNYATIFRGATLESGVFVGSYVCFANDLYPRSINPDESLKDADKGALSHTLVKHGASVNANSTIAPGVTIGAWAMISAGSVVTQDVVAHGLVLGNPARLHDFICKCGKPLELTRAMLPATESALTITCSACHSTLTIPRADLDQLV